MLRCSCFIVIILNDEYLVGWQYQQSTPTVQCILEEALTKKTKINRKELCLVGASRTDAGVHAWGQVCFPCQWILTNQEK